MEFQIRNETVNIPIEHLLSRADFNRNVINKLFILVDNQCAICYEPFDDENPQRFLGGNCKCMTVYHQHCIQIATERFRACPTCRVKNVPIVDTKFSNMDIAKYEELFHKAQGLLEGEARLIFIINWKRQIPAQYLSISTLIDPYAFLTCLRYDPKWQICPIFDTNANYVEFEPPKYKPGDQTIKDKEKFKQHFQKFTYGIIDDSFNWDGIVIAGGSISKLLMRHMEIQDYPLDSDIDFFIYGRAPKDRSSSLSNILTYFATKFSNKVFFAVKGYVIDIYIVGIERTIQIIMASNNSIDDILYHFDMDSVQVAYQGGNILATPRFIASFKHQVSQIDDTLFRMRRIVRMKGTGMGLLTFKNNVGNVIKYIKERGKLFYSPHSSEIFEEITKNIAEVSSIPQTSITQDPAKCISLLKTDASSSPTKPIATKYGTFRVDESFVLDINKFDDFPGLQFQNKWQGGQQRHVIKYPGINEILVELGAGTIHTKVAHHHNFEISVGFRYKDDEIHNLIKKFIEQTVDIYKKQIKPSRTVVYNPCILTIDRYTKIIQNSKRIDNSQIFFKGKADQILVAIDGILSDNRHRMDFLKIKVKEIRLG